MVAVRGPFIEGAKVGLILATVECAIRSIVNPLVSPFVTADALSTVLLPFVAYPLLIGLATSLTALVTHARPDGVALSWAAIGVAAACFPIVGQGTRYEIAAAVLAVIVSCIVAPGLLNAWSASILLIAPPWVTRELLLERPRKVKAVVIALSLVAFVAALFAAHRIRAQRRLPTTAVVLAVLVAAVLLNPNVPLARTHAASNRRPNIVLVTLDTVRADHLPLYGYARNTTAALTGFAKNATLFRRAVAPSNYTLPSHTSMFTGLYASVHGNTGIPGQRLSHAVATLTETLAAFGYQTIAVAANSAYLQSPFGIERGFQYHDSRWRLDVAYSPRDALFFSRSDADLTPYRRADEIESEAAALLRHAAGRPHPFFLFVNFMDAHDPYAPPGPYATLFPGRIRGLDLEPLIERLLAQMPHATPSPAERAHLISQYDGGIAFADHHLGLLLDALNTAGAADDTLVIVAADHGEAFGEHGTMKHGNSLFEEELHVPLVVKYPHQDIGSVRDDVVSLNDIYPTVLQVAKIAPPHRFDAVPLQQSPAGGRVVVSEMFDDVITRSAFDGRRKVIYADGVPPKGFDLANDPGETHPQPGPVPQNLMDAITTLAHAKSLAAPASRLDDETIRHLRALGYLH